jgi:hypothetical protein
MIDLVHTSVAPVIAMALSSSCTLLKGAESDVVDIVDVFWRCRISEFVIHLRRLRAVRL